MDESASTDSSAASDAAARVGAGLQLRWLGRVDYEPTCAAMRAFTAERTADTPDALWLCEHRPVFTQGVAGRPEHLHDAGDVPVVRSDRGGQVTFHGPGQVVAYPLLDLRRLNLHVREYVARIEQALLGTLQELGVAGLRVPGAPGIYVRLDMPPLAQPRGPEPAAEPSAGWRGLGKIAALGIKATRRGAYHGAALNVAMDLRPFDRIDPCGHVGLRTIDLSTIGVAVEWSAAATLLAGRLQAELSP